MARLCRLMLIAGVLACAYAAVALLAAFWPVSLLFAAALACALGYRHRRGLMTAFGTAEWATPRRLRAAGMIDARRGLILGRAEGSARESLRHGVAALLNPRLGSGAACREFLASLPGRRGGKGPLVRLPHAVHTAVFAPTGVGKGVSFVVPELLTNPASMVVIDFKGENAKLTARHRERAFGHRVVLLDPFRVVTQHPDSLNPLDFIDADDPLSLDACRALAGALVIRTGQEKEPHWLDSAELWITSMCLVTVLHGPPDNRSLQTVRWLLTDAQAMQQAVEVLRAEQAWGGIIARYGNQLTRYLDKELASTMTTTNRFLNAFDTVAIAENTKESSFDPGELNQGRMTVYLILPPEHMRAQSPLLRLWIVTLLRAVVKGGLRR